MPLSPVNAGTMATLAATGIKPLSEMTPEEARETEAGIAATGVVGATA